jgi:DNA ligase-associated metallophosphoesterase
MKQPNDNNIGASCEIEWWGKRFCLLGDRALWLPVEQVLAVADLHLGKALTFQEYGLAVPHGSTGDDLARLARLIEDYQPKALCFLGDFFHAKAAQDDAVRESLQAWRSQFANLPMLLIRGNHDRHAGDPHESLQIECVDEPHEAHGIKWRHHPLSQEQKADAEEVPSVAGHLHPAYRMRLKGGVLMRPPVFVVSSHQIILPAFGSFTGHMNWIPKPDETLYLTHEGDVVCWNR